MQLSPEDRRLISDSIHRVCQDLSVRSFSRPEAPCDAGDFLAARELLVGQGMLNTSDEQGCGLWEDCAEPENLELTLALLATVAATNAALAFSLHRAALARHVLLQLGQQLPDEKGIPALSLCLHGHHGLGRGELACWWRGHNADEALLADVFDAKTPRLALMQRNTRRVLCPVFEAGALQWRLCGAGHSTEGTHGLDELCHGHVIAGEGMPLPVLTPDLSRALTRDLWHRDWLGLLAIQQGCVRQSFRRASEYSALRYQGGHRIDAHPAVQTLMSEVRLAIADTESFLRGQSLSREAFGLLLLMRNRLQDAMNAATNAAMQVFGGIGYMRDNGMEKYLRDVNQLRYQSGGPLDMQMLTACWEKDE